MESSAELSSEEMDLDLENVGDQNDAKNTKDQKKVFKKGVFVVSGQRNFTVHCEITQKYITL